jgi:hypothetical protein
MDEKLLYSITDEYKDELNLKISNKNVRTNKVERFHVFKDSVAIGHFSFRIKESYSYYVEAFFQYVDADVTIVGKCCKDEIVFDMTLKKGWNIVYIISEDVDDQSVSTFTTEKPNIELQWRYESWF